MNFRPLSLKGEPIQQRRIAPGEVLMGSRVLLRPVTLDDCNDRYVGWLQDPEVNRYLETRWHPQTFASVRSFVEAALRDPSTLLLAIIERTTGLHVGNIKLGPINPYHEYADVSYFIGERSARGKGYATEAISLVTEFAFSRLLLHRVQAGVYEENLPSIRALEKAGFSFDGRFRKKLKAATGWQDHLWYYRLRPERESQSDNNPDKS